jgi:succinyl-CoA synthetase beta subunit
MLASSQGGINIEEVAVESPESILTEPVDILSGLQPEQAFKVATFMGFEGDKVDQVFRSTMYYLLSAVILLYDINPIRVHLKRPARTCLCNFLLAFKCKCLPLIS